MDRSPNRLAAATLLAAGTLAVLPMAADAQMPNAGSRPWADPLVGVWLGVVTQFDCTTQVVLAEFEGWQLINQGGTYSTTGSAPPTSGSPGFGYWKRQDDGTYFERHRFIRFAPDGSLMGYTEVTKQATLSADAKHKTSSIQSLATAPDGTVVGARCAREVSVRFE
jgi:hypothetical protein